MTETHDPEQETSRVHPEKFRRLCPPGDVGCADTRSVSRLQLIIGQERAVRSLQFGLRIKDKGFNIFVAGLPGTGRTTAIKRFLEDSARHEPVPSDWCYVTGFHDSYRPNALKLMAGSALGFATDMENLVAGAIKDMRQAFESEAAAMQREATVAQFQQQKQAIIEKLNAQAFAEGFALQPTATGLMAAPLVNGKPMSEEDFRGLTPEQQQAVQEKQNRVEGMIENAIRQARQVDRLAQAALEEAEREIAVASIRHRFEEMNQKYAAVPEAPEHLQMLQADLLAHLDVLHPASQEEKGAEPGDPRRTNLARKYAVNVLVDNSALKGAPVVVERNPTYGNLFGRIEQEAQYGALVTDFTMIRPGSLHRANGGYLVLPAEELLRNPLSWESLKRALVNDEIVIEDAGDKLGYLSTRGLRPEPVPLKIKVILVGRPEIYQALLSMDDHFIELFKVRADFDTQMPRSDDNLANYAAFVAKICMDEKLLPMDATGIARLVEHSSRLVEHQERLSTRFGEIADVIREANYYAAQEQAEFITAGHVSSAVAERFYRSALVQQRVMEQITQGLVNISVEGARVGQLNGLSVIQVGDLTFGQPSRISASIGLGRDGLVDIEREANMGGPIHSKGVMILAGFLTGMFAYDKPLSLSARLVFEQSYTGVDGDSASSAELYALLSALSELPLKQGIAVTGAVDQQGNVQAIGGVNYKIEGFYEVCKARGLNGEQGVMIPASNLPSLMLNDEVARAGQEGLFHIWAIDHITQGIEILSGVPAGIGTQPHTFATGSVFARVDERLRSMANTMVRYNR